MGNALGSKAPPYTPEGAPLPLRFSTSPWTVVEAVKTGGAAHDRAVVFQADKKARSYQAECVSTAVRKLKTMRHPYVLQFIDSVEDDSTVTMVCEAGVPLSLWLDRHRPGAASSATEVDEFQSTVVWGLYTTATALAFLGAGGVVHGNVNVDTVYVTRTGDWKVSGFDLATTVGAGEDAALPPPLWRELGRGGPCPEVARCPELAACDWGALRSLPPTTVDVYAFGVLMLDVFAGPLRSSADATAALARASRREVRLLPPALGAVITHMCGNSSRTRLRELKPFLGHDYFKHPLVGLITSLDRLALLEPGDKQRLFHSLTALLPTLPDALAKYRVLPALMAALEYGAAGGGGTVVLAPILQLGGRLTPAEYGRDIIPCLTRLFASQDRATRVQLLHFLPTFLDKLTDAVVNDAIFPHLTNGFTDTNPVLREATVKSALPLAPRLTDVNRYKVLLPALRGCLSDPEPAIRVNTTICLGRIAHTITDSGQRTDTLLPALLRQLRDAFPHARAAALKALAHCITLDTHVPHAAGITLDATASAGKFTSKGATEAVGYWGAETLSKKVLPAASYMTLDGFGDARAAAFLLAEVCLDALKSHSDTLRKKEEADAAVAAAAASAATPGGVSDDGRLAGGNTPSTMTSTTAGLLGWAVSSLASRIVATGEMDTTPSMRARDATPTAAGSGTTAPVHSPPPALMVGGDGAGGTQASRARPPTSTTQLATVASGWDDDAWDELEAAGDARGGKGGRMGPSSSFVLSAGGDDHSHEERGVGAGGGNRRPTHPVPPATSTSRVGPGHMSSMDVVAIPAPRTNGTRPAGAVGGGGGGGEGGDGWGGWDGDGDLLAANPATATTVKPPSGGMKLGTKATTTSVAGTAKARDPKPAPAPAASTASGWDDDW